MNPVSKHIDNAQVELLRKKLEGFKCQNPTDGLVQMYEMNYLVELLYLRAEMYDSPENRDKLEELRKKTGDNNALPRNILNPNYTHVFNLVKKIREGDRDAFTSLQDFALHLNTGYPVQWREGLKSVRCWDVDIETKTRLLDPRLYDTLPEMMDYFYNKYLT